MTDEFQATANTPKEAFLSSEIQFLLDPTYRVAVGWAFDEDGCIDWENTEWIGDSRKPSFDEYSAARETLDIQKKRRTEYPSVVDQLDVLFHGGYDAWKQQIQEIKDRYPKP